nr:phosphopantetheine-binding protein [Micromonospora sp. DSM 115978]
MDAVVEVIGAQTGYPAEMLEPDLDLEADLSIDSIKRTEILGELAQRLGLAGAGGGELDESVVEELAKIKSIRGIADWIVASSGAGEPAESAEPAGAASAVASDLPTGGGAPTRRHPLRRFVLESVPVAELPRWETAAQGAARGGRFAVVEGGLGIGLAVATLLENVGAQVRILAADDPELLSHVDAGVGADGLLWVASV